MKVLDNTVESFGQYRSTHVCLSLLYEKPVVASGPLVEKQIRKVENYYLKAIFVQVF